MFFPTMSRTVVTQILATLFVLLIVSPYTEPFATIHGTDSAAGAIDVGGTAKSKSGSDDGLATPPMVELVAALVVFVTRPVAPIVTRDVRDRQRVILRQ